MPINSGIHRASSQAVARGRKRLRSSATPSIVEPTRLIRTPRARFSRGAQPGSDREGRPVATRAGGNPANVPHLIKPSVPNPGVGLWHTLREHRWLAWARSGVRSETPGVAAGPPRLADPLGAGPPCRPGRPACCRHGAGPFARVSGRAVHPTKPCPAARAAAAAAAPNPSVPRTVAHRHRPGPHRPERLGHLARARATTSHRPHPQPATPHHLLATARNSSSAGAYAGIADRQHLHEVAEVQTQALRSWMNRSRTTADAL